MAKLKSLWLCDADLGKEKGSCDVSWKSVYFLWFVWALPSSFWQHLQSTRSYSAAANQGLSCIQATHNNAVNWITEHGSSNLAAVEKSLALV